MLLVPCPPISRLLFKMADPTTKIEFAVQMTCQSCVNAVKQVLSGESGVNSFTVNLEQEQVIVETSLPSWKIQEILESTGRPTIMRGHGAVKDGRSKHLGAAVVILEGEGDILGLARFLQVSEDNCMIDGTVDNLQPGRHGLSIHEFGDISEGCASTGNHFNPTSSCHGGPEDEQRHIGDLGNICAAASGRATFQMVEKRVKVWDVIGRSLVVHKDEDDLGRGSNESSAVSGNAGPGIACGIIARSAGLFQNTKKFCACDGKTLWEDKRVTMPNPAPPAQL